MTFLRMLFFFPMLLTAFEPRVITPYPVLGYREVSFGGEGRSFSVWYPVGTGVQGSDSASGWDNFRIALDAPPAPTKTKRSVIVLSHGYTGTPNNLSWLISGLVHHGFFVIAITHEDLIEGEIQINFWKRANDTRQMIDEFSRSSLADFADLNRIGIAGYSLGGTTAIWVAGGRTTKLATLMPGPEYVSTDNFAGIDQALPSLDQERMAQNWQDARVKAAFVMAPAWSWLFDINSLNKISIPMYFVAAEGDKVLVTENNAGFFAKHIPKSLFQSIKGKAGHYIFISALDFENRRQVDPSQEFSLLFEDDVTVDRRWIQSQLVEESVRFFNDVFGK